MMRRNVLAAVLLTILAATGCGGTTSVEDVDEQIDVAVEPETTDEPLADETVAEKDDSEIYAVIKTSMGTVTCKLFPEKTPQTCDNFVGLAEGTIAWKDPRTGAEVNRPFYDGLIFHRVIPGFMIQGGCPLGTGTGGPGYMFGVEIDPELNYNEPGKLAMARSTSRNSVGSQFFITDAPATGLNGDYTIFGEVVTGLDVVKNIAKVPRNSNNRPYEQVTIEQVKIVRGSLDDTSN